MFTDAFLNVLAELPTINGVRVLVDEVANSFLHVFLEETVELLAVGVLHHAWAAFLQFVYLARVSIAVFVYDNPVAIGFVLFKLALVPGAVLAVNQDAHSVSFELVNFPNVHKWLVVVLQLSYFRGQAVLENASESY